MKWLAHMTKYVGSVIRNALPMIDITKSRKVISEVKDVTKLLKEHNESIASKIQKAAGK